MNRLALVLYIGIVATTAAMGCATTGANNNTNSAEADDGKLKIYGFRINERPKEQLMGEIEGGEIRVLLAYHRISRYTIDMMWWWEDQPNISGVEFYGVDMSGTFGYLSLREAWSEFMGPGGFGRVIVVWKSAEDDEVQRRDFKLRKGQHHASHEAYQFIKNLKEG